MKKIVSIFLLAIMLCSLTACGDNGLFVVKNISHTPGEYREVIIGGSSSGDISSSEPTYTVSDGTYSYDLVGIGTTNTIYTVQVRIGIYDKSNNHLGDIYDVITLQENETKTITGTCVGWKDVKFKVLKITWNQPVKVCKWRAIEPLGENTDFEHKKSKA